MKIIFTSLLLIFSFQLSFAQKNYEISAEENTYKNSKIYFNQNLFTEFDRYSVSELINFSEKLNTLPQTNSIGWEGIYSDGSGSEVGISNFIWNKDKGFVSYYVYTCQPSLRSLNYGAIKETVDTLEIIPQIDQNSIRKNVKLIKYVKVNWSQRKYLVEESSLLAFAEHVAGIYVEPEDSENDSYLKWSNFWVTGDFDRKLIGMPVFPNAYKKFERKAIETKIKTVGKRTIEKDKSLGNTFYSESAFYEVIIEGGLNKKIKERMSFYCPKIQNFVYITKVHSNYSEGFVRVDIDESKKDYCIDEENKPKKCPQIKPTLFVTTQKQE